ncbi:MAG TPA: ATP-binding cassette domain-containing protein, partial [Candidatus Polarisedimenticolia bacterium]|nr:ATP-binding cassette domain-containing protein [Candidatus Polarisedimenticolia bacterium]
MRLEEAGTDAETPTIIELTPEEARRADVSSSKAAQEHKADKLLQVRGLSTHFFTPDGVVQAVDDVTFELGYGETLGLVGESGCGKSVTATSILRLVPHPPGRILDGAIRFDDIDILKLKREELPKIRGKDIAMIFQDPMTSLNPVHRIGDQIIEQIQAHEEISDAQARDR